MGRRNKAGGPVDREGAFAAPIMSAHVAHAVETRAFFDRNDRGPYIADKNTGLQNVNLFNSSDGSLDLAAIHEHPGGHDAFDDGVLSDD